jgi:hypothetical protein
MRERSGVDADKEGTATGESSCRRPIDRFSIALQHHLPVCSANIPFPDMIAAIGVWRATVQIESGQRKK